MQRTGAISAHQRKASPKSGSDQIVTRSRHSAADVVGLPDVLGRACARELVPQVR
jgi:hypothetical protein